MRPYTSSRLNGQLQPEQNQRFMRSGSEILRWLALVAVFFATLSAYAFQDSPALHAVTRPSPHPKSNSAPKPQEQSSSGHNTEDYKPLLEELGRLQDKLVQGVQFPAPRTQSRLLPLVPSTSSFYVGLPNYGDALHQAYEIFQQELQQSDVLKDVWQNKVGVAGLIVDEVITKIYQLSQFLGDEIAVSGTVNPKTGSVVVIAELRKPGLKAFIQQLVGQYGNKAKPPVRVYTPEQLALVKTQPAHKPLLILVRADYVVAASDLATLRSANAQLGRGATRFTSSPFGQKIAQQYEGGAGVVFGADLHQLLSLRPHGSSRDEATFNQTGFADVKYAVGEGKFVNGMASTSAEVSFQGPRKGVAAWLGGPAPLTGLDFLSPDAGYAIALNFKNFGQVFEDIRNMARSNNPMADSSIAELESQLKINLKDDLFSKFSGQIVAAVDGPIAPMPAWKVVAQLTDSNGLERTLKQLIAFMGQNPGAPKVTQETEGGVSYYSLQVPSGPKPMEVVCAFTDGFLVAAGSRRQVRDAIQLRNGGNSLSKASEFQELLPSDGGNGASGIFYQNVGKALGSMGMGMEPDQAQLFEMISKYSKPSASTVYASEDAIRFVGRSRGFDSSAALLMAAVAIPNLLHSKQAANEVSATATVRTLNSAEGMYYTTYAKYAPDLATLGPGPGEDCSTPSEKHACSIDARLGCSGPWCFSNGFRFNVTGQCDGQMCSDYVVVGTPIDPNQATKSFCSTSDGVVRSRPGPPLHEPISAADCAAWEPI